MEPTEPLGKSIKTLELPTSLCVRAEERRAAPGFEPSASVFCKCCKRKASGRSCP
jgi:hypothetical protein